jgi:pimeloyl-ACP methyl ester carboxylesterase
VNASLELNGPDAAIGYYRAIFAEADGGGDPDDGALFGPVAVPALSLMGADDGCIDARLLAGQEAYWDASVTAEVLAGCGHFLHLERPDDVHRRVLGFLAEQLPCP